MDIGLVHETSFAAKVRDYLREYWDSADERLLKAVEDNDLEEVAMLLAQGVDPNTSTERREFPLIQAVLRAQSEMVGLLLKWGANTEVRGECDKTPLMEAVRIGHESIIRRLLAAKADPNALTRSGGTALWEAVNWRRLHIAEMLLAKGAKVDGDGGTQRDTPLMKASSQGDCDMVRLLLQKGADPNLQNAGHGWTALILAAHYGHERIVLQLIKQGANPDLQDATGRTPLIAAYTAGYCNLASKLIRYTQNLEAVDPEYGWTGALWATAQGDLSALKQLHARGARLNTRGKQGETLLDLARARRHIGITRWLKRRSNGGV